LLVRTARGLRAVRFPGFSGITAHHGKADNAMIYPLNQIPRQKGGFIGMKSAGR